MILKNEAENFIKDILEKLLCTNINFKLIFFFQCGFFRRKRPDESTASQKPLVYKNGQQTTYTNDFMSRQYE